MSFVNSLTIAPTSISITEARDKLSELTERAHYRFEQFRIARKDKPIARIVSDEYMQVIDQLVETDPGLADTIALMLNKDALAAIEEGIKEVERGELIPLHAIRDEI
jgi:antitoxin (DNA-binding transcriptional repressor) of toxin-antitoxin stability system